MANLFNFGMGKKDRKMYVLAQNKERGKFTENLVVLSEQVSGKKVVKTGRGHDIKTIDTNPWTGKKKIAYIEIKSSRSAPLSKLQKKTKKKMKDRYKVVRFGI